MRMCVSVHLNTLTHTYMCVCQAYIRVFVYGCDRSMNRLIYIYLRKTVLKFEKIIIN